VKFHKYYYRAIGFALAGAGAGLVLDELIHGPFTLTPANHEFWGLVAIIAGAILISKKPHGKD
jgi:predicted metal-dependent enzyme (double-stranded beta helix superfamily)